MRLRSRQSRRSLAEPVRLGSGHIREALGFEVLMNGVKSALRGRGCTFDRSRCVGFQGASPWLLSV